ncbi:Abi family protein [Eubacteriaceae bacterium ES2]|nr:Abi family protein [Eubacteriaceae bacterium ES2]
MKDKLSIDGQIAHLKSKGITFNHISEEAAKEFITYNTYFFKIKSYAKNYEKYQNGEKKGQYVNLDFAYLVELSKIDMHLSRLLLKITLDIEHALKVALMRDITNNSNEDGHEIVLEFFDDYNDGIYNNLTKKEKGSTCSNLISKYDPNYPVWVLIECLSLGDFITFYEFYYIKYQDDSNYKIDNVDILDYLWSFRFLRNSCAHCNCIINSLNKPYKRSIKRSNSTKKAITYLSKIPDIHKDSRRKKMDNPVVNDFVATLLLYDLVVKSEGMKEHRIMELKELFCTRIVRNKQYFENNAVLKTTYEFIMKFLLSIFPEIG